MEHPIECRACGECYCPVISEACPRCGSPAPVEQHDHTEIGGEDRRVYGDHDGEVGGQEGANEEGRDETASIEARILPRVRSQDRSEQWADFAWQGKCRYDVRWRGRERPADDVLFVPLLASASEGDWAGLVVFDHLPRGTCVPGCALYGLCHCGCGKATTIVQYAHKEHSETRGRPRIYRSGHNPRPRPNLPMEVYLKAGRNGKRPYVPIERVQPLVRWLRARYGNYRQAALATGLDSTRLARWGQARVTCVHPRGAKRLVDVVLAHRIPEASRSMWDTPRRLMSDEEREAEWKRQQREERARYRKKAAA